MDFGAGRPYVRRAARCADVGATAHSFRGNVMRRFALSLCAVVAVACAKSEQPAATDTAAAVAAPAAPAAMTLDQLAGTWNLNVSAEGSDSTLLKIVVTAAADGNAWTIKYPDRPDPVPARATAAGDSVVVEAGPYTSPIRKNVETTIHAVWRLQGDSLGGPVTAHYNVKTADSVRVFRAMGTRAP